MAQIKCEECGQMFDGKLESCPNCGCPNNQKGERIRQEEQFKQSSDSVYKLEQEEVDYDDLASVNEPKWLEWIKPWHFFGRNDKEQACYNVLNDFSLVATIILKMLAYIGVYFLIAAIIYAALSFSLADESPYLIFILGIFFDIVAIILAFKAFRKAVGIYWIPLLKAHRRIHARYWKAMYKAVKK